MLMIAANGILVIISGALFLAHKTGVGEFDIGFYAVQAI
jgi:hypothetical protein